MNRAALIVNPFASGVTEERVEAVAASLGRPEVIVSERPGHATEIARTVRGRGKALFVFSGDGGFNEVLNGVRDGVLLGFVPGGGSSVLARALGLPRDPVAAARRLATGRPRRISVGRVNGRRFGFSAGLGFDAEVVRRVDALGRASGRRAGDFRVAVVALRLLAERRARFGPALEVRGLGRAAFALVANCDPYTYAGPVPLHVAPAARFELGLDVAAPRELRSRSLPRYVAYLLRGDARPQSLLYAHDRDRVEVACDRALPLQADGEDLGDVTEAVFEAERDAVTVLV